MDGLVDLNPDDFLEHKQSEADKALAVKFYTKSVQDKAETLKQGRPIFKEVPYIDIRIPGERDSAFCGPATQAHVQRFPQHYQAFRARTSDEEVVGTPLIEWPMITRSQAEELSFFNVKTVEQLASMPDSGNHQFMGIHGLKAKAAEYLAKSTGTEALLQQIADMQKKLDALSQPKPKARSAAKPRINHVSPADLNS